MYLVDTSVWLDFINGKDEAHVAFLDQLLLNPLATGLMELVYMEILQGSKTRKDFDKFSRYFSGQTFYPLKGKSCYAAAARLYFECRKKGITIRSTIDCLIAQCAIENGLVLLHNDRDFQHMGKVAVDLRQKCFLQTLK